MEFIYYPDHDQRYAHLSEMERKLYPDEIRWGSHIFKRDKTFEELWKEKPLRDDRHLLRWSAKDIPTSKLLSDRWLK